MSFKKLFFLLALVCSCMGLSEAKATTQTLLKNPKPLSAEKLFLSSEKLEKEEEKTNFKTKSNPSPNRKEDQEKLNKNIEIKKPALYGTVQKLFKSDLKRFSSPFPNKKDIDFIISVYLLEKSKKPELFCPAGYELKNNYSLYGEMDFMSKNKNSCLGKEAQETYSLNKKWIVEKKDKKNLVSAYDKILKWLLDLFFYPYIPGSFKTPPKEFRESKLDQACPSCSFRFEYNYRYKPAGFIDFDVKAICTDKKRAFSKIKQDTYIINNWSCIKNLEP